MRAETGDRPLVLGFAADGNITAHLLRRARVDAHEVLQEARVEAQHARRAVARADRQDRPPHHRPAVLVHLRARRSSSCHAQVNKWLPGSCTNWGWG